ncbi:pyridoxamine 5'-phosphate oxidase family protein [Zavarzinia sp.]|uniref:pyridoxamine 5'-phosphate oxidase family protein n=1 Tax=Zavarzinia sp. TaxID=2027920 RepID=UPI003563FB75
MGPLFHTGEQEVQRRAGTRDQCEQIGPHMIRDHMPDQHRAFFASLPLLLVGSVDGDGRVWASALAGAPGFMESPDPSALVVRALPPPGSPLAATLALGAPLGLLGIEPETQRRNRMNGTVVGLTARGFAVRVRQSFGNCPQYIQRRRPTLVVAPKTVEIRTLGRRLNPGVVETIRLADTFYLATASATAGGPGLGDGADMSHRGGRPGFVRIEAGETADELLVPDFRGNGLFNSFGNIAANPKAGLLFIDYADGTQISLTGEAEVIWEGPMLAAFAGAERLLRFRLTAGVIMPGALPLRWSDPVPARQLVPTGTWDETGF